MTGDDGFRVLFNVLALIQACMALFSACFFAAALADSDPMLPEIYGRAVDYPATWWAGWLMLGHGLAVSGLMYGATRIAVGSLVLVTPAYFLLAIYANPAAFGSVITLHSLLVGGPVQIITIVALLMFGGKR